MKPLQRNPRLHRQTCRVAWCQKAPAEHTTVQFSFGKENGLERLFGLPLDLCETHMEELEKADNRDEVFVDIRHDRVRPWEPYETRHEADDDEGDEEAA